MNRYDDIFDDDNDKSSLFLNEDYQQYLIEWHKNYGTDKSLLLKDIRNAGFKPIGITVMLCEETFIFETIEECEKAAKMFLPEGWWYDLETFKKERTEYIDMFYSGDETIAANIFWL